MSSLPRVTELARERIAREFDDLGPQACMAEILDVWQRHNPELLDMARKCAADVDDEAKAMIGFGMFYQLLDSGAGIGARRLSALPRVSPKTRTALVREIDADGPELFTLRAIENLESTNPELLQMAHSFATHSPDYVSIVQGFALLYRALLLQSASDQRALH